MEMVSIYKKSFIVRMLKNWEDLGFCFKKRKLFSVNDGGYGVLDISQGGSSDFWYAGMYHISKKHCEIEKSGGD